MRKFMAQENRHQTYGKGNSFRNAARLTDNIRACLQCADCQSRKHCQEKQYEMQKGKFFHLGRIIYKFF